MRVLILKSIIMKKLNFSQITFFNECNNSKFENKVLSLSESIGIDGAFYFMLGETQSLINNYSFDDLTEDDQEDFISALIIEMPTLEF